MWTLCPILNVGALGLVALVDMGVDELPLVNVHERCKSGVHLTLTANSIKEMTTLCREFIEKFGMKEYKSQEDGTRMRQRKPWTQSEVQQLVQWTKQNKRVQWIALQLNRKPIGVSQMLVKLRKVGDLPKRRAGAVIEERPYDPYIQGAQ